MDVTKATDGPLPRTTETTVFSSGVKSLSSSSGETANVVRSSVEIESILVGVGVLLPCIDEWMRCVGVVIT